MNLRNALARLLVINAFAITCANAHETWLLPATPATVGKPLTLQLTSSMVFPKLDYALQAARVPVAFVRTSGTTTELKSIKRAAHAVEIKVTPALPGIATAWVSLPEKFISLSPNKVNEYFDEIDAPADMRDAWKKRPAPKQWREFYRKNAKAVFVVAAAGAATDNADTSWREPVGTDLELVPLTNIADFTSGNEFAISVVRNGKPVPQFPLSMSRQGAKVVRGKSDDNGVIKFVFSGNGPWLVYGTLLKAASRPDAEWESEFVTITLSASPQTSVKH